MKKKNVIGENVEAGTNAESDEKAGTKIYRTDKMGEIILKINKIKIWEDYFNVFFITDKRKAV